ncbi:LpqB family beta-propeller domain-containing protein [Propionibacteriaceae bacterium G1746]|uniref:LpqB family beta-propeller domain-containing protein n=1 Tax=Aestuariimicrobium sp. G57 TaxID=3418485 RepID=UPI003C23F83C
MSIPTPARAFAIVLAVLLVFTSCARIPTTGPVQQVGPSPSSRPTVGIDIDAQPPVPGADPDLVLAGFLAAMSTFEPDYASARLYLTPEAAKIWDPDAGTTIYQSEGTRPIISPTSASLNVPLVGRLDAAGRYTPAQDRLLLDFGMQHVGGEWRISQPPTGLLIAKYVFDRYYVPLKVAFLAADGSRFAHEQVYLHRDALTPTTAVKALLAGPSPWLAPAVTTAVPGDTRLSANAVTVTDGIAEVSLTEQVASLTEQQRSQLAAQLVATLEQFDQVRGVRVLTNGQPLPVRGQGSDGVVTRAMFSGFDLLDGQTDAPVHVAAGGRLGVVDNGQVVHLQGVFGQPNWGGVPGTFAVQRNGGMIGVVNDKSTALYVAARDATRLTATVAGTRLVRPQVRDDGSVWTIDHAGGVPTLVSVSVTGTVGRHPIGELRGRTVVSFRISPDGTRIALLLANGQGTDFGLVRLRGTDRVTVDGWRKVAVNSSSGPLGSARDVVWADPESVQLLAAVNSSGAFNIYLVRADGAVVENLGPIGASGAPVALSAFPRRQGMTSVYLADSGAVFRFEGAYRWQRFVTDVTAVALPG